MSVESASIDAGAFAERRTGRFVYVVMAGLFIAVAAVGFGPRSVAILSGELRNPPLIVHAHAVLMASWLLLFLVQTSLMSRGSKELHRRLGRISFVLAPAIFVLLTTLAIATYNQTAAAANAANPAPPEILGKGLAFSLCVMGRAALLFGVFYGWAALARRTAPETHKRMMVMATFVVIDAGLGRIASYGWLPGASADTFGAGGSYDAVHVYQLALLAPVLIYDVIRSGRVHRAYVISIGLFLPFVLLMHFAWDSPWWQQSAARLFGA